MSKVYLSPGVFPEQIIRPVIQDILKTQLEDGCIPWFTGGHADPWDHTEAAMALSIVGEYDAAVKAYRWLQQQQLSDGSWWISYKNGQVFDNSRKETNFVAYVATGVWHHYLITQDHEFAAEMWPMVQRALSFVMKCQSEFGDVAWSVDCEGNINDDSLLTGCSSIYKSLECGYNLSVVVDDEQPQWLEARKRLGDVIRNHPERFDRTWESKARYSMDWFYPILTGAIQGAAAKQRLSDRWDEFVIEEMGCRCVSDEPWVTVAESCELTMALVAAGEHKKAAKLYSWLHDFRDEQGVYWTGWQFEEKIYWPDEKPTWTGGSIILAADALTHKTPASRLFTHIDILDPEEFEQTGVQRRAELLKES